MVRPLLHLFQVLLFSIVYWDWFKSGFATSILIDSYCCIVFGAWTSDFVVLRRLNIWRRQSLPLLRVARNEVFGGRKEAKKLFEIFLRFQQPYLYASVSAALHFASEEPLWPYGVCYAFRNLTKMPRMASRILLALVCTPHLRLDWCTAKHLDLS